MANGETRSESPFRVRTISHSSQYIRELFAPTWYLASAANGAWARNRSARARLVVGGAILVGRASASRAAAVAAPVSSGVTVAAYPAYSPGQPPPPCPPSAPPAA